MRNQRIGVERTMEEVGRAFPGVALRMVDAEHPLESIDEMPQLLFITPGMEPTGSVTLAVVLDADAVLGRHDLSASIEAVRRWLDVAALVGDGGRMMIVGQATAPAVQALVRNDPVGFAERELGQRAAAGLPPATHVVVVVAPSVSRVAQEIADACTGAALLGPVPAAQGSRWVVLHQNRSDLTAAVRAVLATRSASKSLAGISVRVDPLELPT